MRNQLLFLLLSLCLTTTAQEANLDSLKRQLQIANGKEQIQTLIELCIEYRFVNADAARQYGIIALEKSRQSKFSDLEGDALHNIGVTHEAQGNYDQALEYELQALAIRKKSGDQIKIAKTLNNIGIVYDEKGNYDKSLEYYFDARRVFEKENDQAKVAMVINNIGIVLKAQKEYKKVVGYYREALGIYKKLNNKFGIAACDTNLGSVYLNLNQYDSALFFSLIASQEFEELNNQQFLATSVFNAGMAYFKLGRDKEARETLTRATSLFEAYDNKKELSSVLTYLAGVERTAGNISKGIDQANRGLSIAQTIGARDEVMQARKELSLLWAAKSDFKKAFSFHQSYASIKDSLYESEKSKQISELQTKYDTEKKETKINLLTQETRLKSVQLRQGILAIAVLVLLLVALVGIGLLLRNRTKLKQQADLEAARAELRQQQLQAVIASQEEERKRFAADLHDGLGQMISAMRLGLSKDTIDTSSVQYALGLMNDMNVEIRNIAFNLMPQVLMKDGLHEALQEFAQRISNSGGIKVEVQTYNLNPAMASEERIALYRICQEWVNNVIKYSGAKQIILQAVQHVEELVITIEDNGDGFNKRLLTEGKGNGWKNINSRLSLIRGNIEIDSEPDRKGTIAILSVPV